MQLAVRIMSSERHLVSQATCPNGYGDSLPTIVFSGTQNIATHLKPGQTRQQV